MDKIYGFAEKNYCARLYVAFSTETVERMNKIHQTTATAAAAAGRLLTASAMMGRMQKEDDCSLTVTLNCTGVLTRVTAVADSHGNVKCDILNPSADAPRKPNGKLNVSGIVGSGTLTVIKDLNLKSPYIGQIDLVSGEIAEDFTYYFASSEQTPSAVGLGVHVKAGEVVHAGGFIVQLMPDADEEIVGIIEKNVGKITSFTDLMNSGLSADDIAREIFGTIEYEPTGESELRYHCGCSREKIEKTLTALGADELNEMINENKPIDVLCHFCARTYRFTADELRRLLENAL